MKYRIMVTQKLYFMAIIKRVIYVIIGNVNDKKITKLNLHWKVSSFKKVLFNW